MKSGMAIRLPDTSPILSEQPLIEVKGINASPIMVQSKCIEVDNSQGSKADAASKLYNKQWQALIAHHHILLHEHHDFFFESQHPTASAALRRLASEYAMPGHTWWHGIHSFLGLLRHWLPTNLKRMLTFLHLVYSRMAILYETIPAFKDRWLECFGGLGRCVINPGCRSC